MLLLVLALAATDVATADPARVEGSVVVGAGGSEADLNEDEAANKAPLWHYFGVAAGLSITSSVLLALPALLVLPFSTVVGGLALLCAAPIVAVVGVARLDDDNPEDGPVYGPLVGVVVGDVIGVVVGGVVGYLGFAQFLDGKFRTTCGDPTVEGCLSDNAIAGAATVVGAAWIGRALGSGVGAVVGNVLSDLLPEPATPHTSY